MPKLVFVLLLATIGFNFSSTSRESFVEDVVESEIIESDELIGEENRYSTACSLHLRRVSFCSEHVPSVPVVRGTLLGWLETCAKTGRFAQMRHSDIETLEVTKCPHQGGCSLIRPGNSTNRNSRCATYNDCCIDAPARRTASRTREVCVPFGDFNLGVYLVATCPRGTAAILAGQCERDDFRDPLLSTPVTDAVSRLTYLNSYCAQCNGAAPRLEPWILSVECSGATNFTWAEVTHSTDGWTVQGRGCKLHFDHPPGIKGGPRLCRVNLTDTCLPQSNRRILVRGCEAYLSIVVEENQVTYRNPHCAHCSGKGVDEPMCLKPTIVTRSPNPFSFAILLDMNLSEKKPEVVTETSCGDGEIYDPYFKKCRLLYCPIPGYTLSNGKCVKQ